MKKSILYIIILITFLFSSKAGAQNPTFCNCDVQLIPVSACCVEIQVAMGLNCAGLIQDLIIDTDGNLPFTGTITSSIANATGVTQSTNASGHMATYSFGPSFVITGSYQTIGELCFTDINNGAVAPTYSMVGSGVTYCDGIVEFSASCPTPGDWKKIYGTADEETVNKVKAFNDGVYVAGRKKVNGIDRATFTKFDITDGSLVWEKYLDMESEFRDFDYNPASDEFIVVGRTLPLFATVVLDNQFIITKFTSSGALSKIKMYDHTGRDGFEQQVVVHKNPIDSDAPIYVVTGKNIDPTVPPTHVDVTIAYNFKNDLSTKWIREYHQVGGGELETQRGIEDLSDGNLLIVGNGYLNYGTVLRINGLTGEFMTNGGYYHQGIIDWYDAIELPNGNILLAGTDWGLHEALMMVVDPVNLNVISGIRFPDVNTFHEAWYDSANDAIYTTAIQNAAPLQNVIYKISFNTIFNTFSPDWAKYLDEGETEFKDPHVFVSDQFNQLFYADARKGHPDGFGDFDLLIGSMDLDMLNCTCTQVFNTNNVASTVTTIPVYCTDPSVFPIPYTTISALDNEGECATFCDPLSCDFTFTASCFDVVFSGTIVGGTPPYYYEWNIDCDASTDGSGTSLNSFNWSFPPLPATQTPIVCMTITDAAGLSCTVQKTVTVQDTTPPLMNCPGNITLNTDPGECYATKILPVPSDNCDSQPVINCTVTGASNGSNITRFNKGISTVTCTAIDASGNVNSCTYTITVVDNEPPSIFCPSNIVVSIPGCEGQAQVFFSPPNYNDNCPNFSYTSTHQSGDYFPCGITTVTYTATDMAGNMNSCSFTINVVCLCAELDNYEITCNSDDELAQDFLIELNSLAGLPNPGLNCTPTVTAAQSGVILSNIVTVWNGQQLTVTGTATLSCPMSNQLIINVHLSCTCPNAPILECTIPVTMNTVCCRTITIKDDAICKVGPQYTISLLDCASMCDEQQVRWYVSNGPCAPSPWAAWGAPFQVTNKCADLVLDPLHHSGDICVYVEVDLGPKDGACDGITLVSNVATITLCEPVTCNVTSSQTYCYDGTSITPTLLVGSLSNVNQKCPYSLQWWDDNGPILGETGLTYQPPALDIPVGSQVCSITHTYTLKVTTVNCGEEVCSASITLYNDDAPNGLLELDPFKTLPLCYGDDATLRYTLACAGDPALWNWLSSTDGTIFTPINTSGTQNPLYNTNRLYQDTWFRIEKKNGACPIDQIDIYIPINPPLQITNFDAVHTPTCVATSVKMFGDFTPVALTPCSYKIDWYRNGQIVHSSNALSGPIAWTYTPASLEDIPGNYYIQITDNCCGNVEKSPVIQVEAPYEAVIFGPCFRCNDQVITLDGVILNPQSGAVCSYQWFDNGIVIPGAISPQLQVMPARVGPFKMEVTCLINGATCVKSDTYNLLQCGSSCPAIINLTGIIPDGIYHAGVEVNLYGTIPAGGNVIVKAGTQINTMPSFTVDPSATFTATIEACPQ